MTLQKRLKQIMRRRNMRVADLARHFGRPYMTVREWALNGREPEVGSPARRQVERAMRKLEA
jgi:hypothetical protein